MRDGGGVEGGVLALAAAPSMGSPLAPFRVLIGTYGPGIYETVFDRARGRFSAPRMVAAARDASFLALSPDGRLLAAALESSGRVALFRLGDGDPEPAGEATSGGSGPCHVSFSADGGTVYVANYGDGTIASFPVTDGRLRAAEASAPNQGRGPDKARQKGPHGHFAAEYGGFVYACDLGTDEVRVFRREGLARLPSGRVPAGAGPRHLAFAGPYVYAVNEMGLSITAFRRETGSGALTPIGTTPLLGKGDRSRGSSGAEIATDLRGAFVYASVRGAERIAAFRIGPSGRLRGVGSFPSGVRGTRSFAISPDGGWVVAAGQQSGDVAALPRDPASGRIGAVAARVSFEGAKPVCVLFGPF